MTEVAGELADGLIAHAFTTERYLREVTKPALERGRARGHELLDANELRARNSAANENRLSDETCNTIRPEANPPSAFEGFYAPDWRYLAQHTDLS